VVLIDDFLRSVQVANLVCHSLNLTIEDVRKPFEEYQRKNVILEFWSVERTSNLTCGLPEPCL
jgi:hypothetical protein